MNWDVLVEFGRSSIVLDQESFIYPVKSKEENACYWVEDWETSGVHEDHTKISVELGIQVMT